MFLGNGKCNLEEGNYFSTMENLPSKIFAASSPFSFSFSNHCFFYLNIYIGLRHISFCLGCSVSYSHIKSSARRIMNIEDEARPTLNSIENDSERIPFLCSINSCAVVQKRVHHPATRHQGKEKLSYIILSFLFHTSYFLYYLIILISYFLYFLISYFLFLKIVVDCAAQCTTPPRKGGALLRSGKRRTTAATETEIGKGHIFIFQIITNSEKIRISLWPTSF